MDVKKLEAHLFVCTNQKPNGECCGAKGGAELRAKVKDLAKTPDWKGRLRVNAAGCLGRCEEGIVAVVYPQGEWLTNLKKDDSEVLLNALARALGS